MTSPNTAPAPLTAHNADGLYRQIFDVAGVGLARVSLDGDILEANPRLASICERSPEALRGLRVGAVTHPDDLAQSLVQLQACILGTQNGFTQELRFLTPSGDARWVQVTAVMVRDVMARPLHFVIVVEDISERRRYQAAILTAQAAERASKAKTEFLSRMSHELRTPLNAMLGFAQLLRADPHLPLHDSQRQKIRHIEQAGAHLLGMLTDVLDLSRIEAGGLPLNLVAVRVADVLGEAFNLVSHQARQSGITLHPHHTDPELCVKADRLRLRQVLVNLLSNAIKYNRVQGEVRVTVRRDLGQISLSVHDTGHGLRPDQVEHLFELFNRLGAEQTRIEGNGIGLVIVQRLVSLMHGQIEVRSEPGRGSVFRVMLPAYTGPRPVFEDTARSGLGDLGPAPQDGQILRVLYAEDNAVNVELMRQIMRMRPQWELLIAENGAQAIALCESERPDLLLLDMHLGDMTGLDVADAVDALHLGRAIPKVALSADVMPDLMAATEARGFIDYLSKPLDMARFLRLLDSLGPGLHTVEGFTSTGL